MLRARASGGGAAALSGRFRFVAGRGPNERRPAGGLDGQVLWTGVCACWHVQSPRAPACARGRRGMCVAAAGARRGSMGRRESNAGVPRGRPGGSGGTRGQHINRVRLGAWGVDWHGWGMCLGAMPDRFVAAQGGAAVGARACVLKAKRARGRERRADLYPLSPPPPLAGRGRGRGRRPLAQGLRPARPRRPAEAARGRPRGRRRGPSNLRRGGVVWARWVAQPRRGGSRSLLFWKRWDQAAGLSPALSYKGTVCEGAAAKARRGATVMPGRKGGACIGAYAAAATGRARRPGPPRAGQWGSDMYLRVGLGAWWCA